MSERRGGDRVVTWHNQIAFLEDKVSCQVDRWYHSFDVDKSQIALLEQLVVLGASSLDHGFKSTLKIESLRKMKLE